MLPALSRISRRHALQGSAAALVVFGLLMWWLLPIGESSPRGKLTFSTGSKSGVYQRYGVLLKQALARDLPEVTIDLRTSEGSQQNLERVAAGEADFTIATADAVAKYKRDGRPGADRLRGCARLYDDYVQLIVPKDSPVRSARDLRGKTVGVGQKGSGVRLVADRLMTATGIDPVRDINPVPAGIDTMPRRLEAGELDAFFWSGGLPTNTVEELSERFEIRLVPLESELVEKLHATGGTTSYYRSAVMPADAYLKAQGGVPVPTMAVANLLVTTDRMDPAMTEGFTRTVINSRDRIGNTVHPAQLVDLRTAVYTAPLDLHEGARRYYRSVKP
ncbi:TAXI family TRAP transporter solute-binding subunit [Streptomyces sp. NBC_01142]|uniref:TAXI family TRAP transporter solute-binding subunit n=1 Tax=Streptomyces sp. NBC_01142 TaxID=2975865 RepID=UPI002257C8B6|nr:TAXI family TRAP transporter solute-binding subunit [Streptomyces sp. NBC_01142]MCX4819799.1 TAXI family TRAP transporter solute-binding subunit [Streptomyces sp. NBC_01142]